jgi:hypothetical protein
MNNVKLAQHFDIEYHEGDALLHQSLHDTTFRYLLQFAITYGLKGKAGMVQMMVAYSQAIQQEREDIVAHIQREPLKLVLECPKCKGVRGSAK